MRKHKKSELLTRVLLVAPLTFLSAASVYIGVSPSPCWQEGPTKLFDDIYLKVADRAVDPPVPDYKGCNALPDTCPDRNVFSTSGMLVSKLCSPGQLVFHHFHNDQLASLHLSFVSLEMSNKFNHLRNVKDLFEGLAIETLIKAASPQANAAQFSKDACSHAYMGNGTPFTSGLPTISCPHGLPEAQLKLLGLVSVLKVYPTEFGIHAAKLRAVDVKALDKQYSTSLGYAE